MLQKIAAQPVTADGKNSTPVAWQCNCLEEVCGACSMVINGRVRQACSALVDNLLKDNPSGFELRPLSKFPVVRDLCVDRSRMFRALERVKAWVPVDDYYNRGPGPRELQDEQEVRYPLSECMTCGCCLEACPQYVKAEVPRMSDESDEEYSKRADAYYDQQFVGAAPISQAMLFNDHSTGAALAGERLDRVDGPRWYPGVRKRTELCIGLP